MNAIVCCGVYPDVMLVVGTFGGCLRFYDVGGAREMHSQKFGQGEAVHTRQGLQGTHFRSCRTSARNTDLSWRFLRQVIRA